MLHNIVERLRRWRGYLVALICVFLVWFFTAMSEAKSYTETYALHIEGIDTARYAVNRVDTTVTLNVESNGFNALYRSLETPRTLHYNVAEQVPYPILHTMTVSIDLAEATSVLGSQIRTSGVHSVKPMEGSLDITVSPREGRAYKPDLSNVKFAFEGTLGLSGDVRIEPDSVVLYGSRESLQKVGSVKAKAVTFKHVGHSATYRVALDPEWKRYADLRSNADSISIYVPVETFVEKSITLPVVLTGDIRGKNIQLHPSQVTLRCMVAEKSYNHIDTALFRATTTYRDDAGDYLDVIISQFPSDVRIVSTTPSRVQYTIIQ